MKNSTAFNFLLLGSSVIVSLLLVEIFLQLLGKPPPVVYGWVNKRSPLETNQLGFRGRTYHYTADDYVIVLLGDSQVAAAACSFDWLPEQRLEYHLNQKASLHKIKVFSIGADGYGQDQQLLLLQTYYQTFRADLVVLWQTPANDVWNNIFPTHWPRNGWPKPTFRIINGALQWPREHFGEELWWSKIKILALAHRWLPLSDRDSLWEQYLPPPYQPLRRYDGTICHDWQERWNANLGLMQEENLATEKSHFAISLTPVSPRMQYGLDLTRALLGAIAHMVTKNQGNFIIFHTQPPKDTSAMCAGDEVVHLLNGKYYKTSRRQLCDNLTYMNAGLTSFTLPITIPHWRVGPENHHLNEHATDQVMHDLAMQIMSVMKGKL